MGDAGEAAEREQKKYGKGGLVSDAADAAGNFQKAVYDSFESAPAKAAGRKRA